MADIQRKRETREQKLQKLSKGTLKGQKKADFYYKMAKILVKDLSKLKELSRLLKATPDSYLGKIDFKEAATAAMDLTEILIQKSKPTHISQELLDGSIHAERFYTIELGDSLPGLRKAIVNLGVAYKPTKEELLFNKRLYDHKTYTMPAIVDHGKSSLKEFIDSILPSIKAKDPNLKITNRGVIGYKPPEEFDPMKEPKEIDPKLLDAIGKLANDIGTGYPQNITALPDYPKLEDENVNMFLKGNYSELSRKLIAEMRERQQKEEPK